MNRQRIKQLFSELSKKIMKEVKEGADLTPAAGPITGSLLIRNGLVLQGDFADKYGETISEAAKYLDSDGPWSAKALDELFATHLTNVIMASDGKQIPKEADALFLALAGEATEYRRGLAVFGLSDDVDKLSFGTIEVEKKSFTPNYDFGPIFKAGEQKATHFARVQVRAVDSQTADMRATRIVRKHLAVLNALCSKRYPSTIILSDRFVGVYDVAYWQLPDLEGTWNTYAESRRDRFPLSKAEIEKNSLREAASA